MRPETGYLIQLNEPQPKVIADSNTDFRSDPDSDVRRIAPKM